MNKCIRGFLCRVFPKECTSMFRFWRNPAGANRIGEKISGNWYFPRALWNNVSRRGFVRFKRNGSLNNSGLFVSTRCVAGVLIIESASNFNNGKFSLYILPWKLYKLCDALSNDSQMWCRVRFQESLYWLCFRFELVL